MSDDLPVRKPSPVRSRFDFPLLLLLCAGSAALTYALVRRGSPEPPSKTVVESDAAARPAKPLPALAPLARIEDVHALRGKPTVVVRFATPVEKAVAELATNYTLEPKAKVESATLGDDGRTVTLQTSPLQHGTEYRLVVSNVSEAFVTLRETRATFRYEDSKRVQNGLVLLYTFEEGGGTVIHDTSDSGEPLNLRIVTMDRTSWKPGAIALRDKRYIASDGFGDKIVSACQASKELSIEAWIQTDDRAQYGSPDIILFGMGKTAANFTLAHEADGFVFRIRTSKSSEEGDTGAIKKTIGTKLTHVVVTRDSHGNARLYVNGEAKLTKVIAGDFSNWNTGYRVFLSTDEQYKKSWNGDLYLAAVYARALSEAEVQQNLTAGPTGIPAPAKEAE